MYTGHFLFLCDANHVLTLKTSSIKAELMPIFEPLYNLILNGFLEK
jgi:hypothetical protein